MASNFIISSDQLKWAADILQNHVDECAAARADRLVGEERMKTLKAFLMTEHVTQSLGAQEREALADERYTTALDELRDLIFRDEKLRRQREAAHAIVEAWRTQEASMRVQQ